MALCKANEGCEREAKKMGFCEMHYRQVQLGARSPNGDLLRPLRARYDGVSCLVDGCQKRPIGRGFCGAHYQQWRYQRIDDQGAPRPEAEWIVYTNPNRTTSGSAGPCKLAGCERQRVHTELGLCGYHYRRLELGIIDAEGNILREEYKRHKYGPEDLCKVEGCGQQARSNFFCKYHAQRYAAGAVDFDGTVLRQPSIGRPRLPDVRWLNSFGYVLVRAPEGHPGANRDGMIFEHRLVMEKKLGRYLLPDEVVHHIDGDRQHNDESNLQVLQRRRHPIATEYTKEQAKQVLSALQHNDPEAYDELKRELN